MPAPSRYVVIVVAVTFALLAAAVYGLETVVDNAVVRREDEPPTQVPADQDKHVFHAEFKPSTETDAPPAPTATWSPPTPELSRQDPVAPTLKELRREPTVVELEQTPTPSAALPVTAPRIEELNEEDDESNDQGSLYYHQQEYDRIRGLLEELEMEIQMAQEGLKAVDDAVEREWKLFDREFERVMKSALPSPRGARSRNLRCMGWKHTGGGQWTGPREPSGDKSCFELISQDDAVGYCVLRDDDTDEYFRVMKSDATTLPLMVVTCRVAPYLANFPAEIERAILENDGARKQHDPEASGNGIVVVLQTGGARQAAALVKTLRGLNCELPVELWVTDDDDGDAMAAELRLLLEVVEGKVEIRSMMARESPVEARIHAIAHSSFENVLYLDVATTPLRDPTYLFSLPEFVSTGTLFWPDLFHPRTTESNIQPASLLWEYLDMDFVNMFEQDDRQLLIRRDLVVERGLRVVELFATHQPNLFTRMQLVENGKDLFRLAWLKSRVPFHMVVVPPTLGGSVLASEPFRFCGSYVVQHDPNGEPLFLHRQGDAVPELDDSIEYAQVFDWRRSTVRGMATSQLSRMQTMLHHSVESHLPPGNYASRCYSFVSGGSGHERVATRPWSEIVKQKERQASVVGLGL